MPVRLAEIALFTRARIEREKRLVPSHLLSEAVAKRPRPLPLTEVFRRSGIHIIAEIKRRSPSAGALFPGADPVVVAGQYAHAGAAAISVLTEPDFFDGSLDALARIRSAFPHVPLLMKDFIVDEYQLLQARAAGADACLLIAALLGEAELARLHALAKRLGLTPLVEIHDESELAVARRLGAELIGVNNRNLATFEVSLDVARRLAAAAWAGPVLIAESGIESSAEINELASLGYKGFLVGTSLMRGGLPGRALRALLEEARCE